MGPTTQAGRRRARLGATLAAVLLAVAGGTAVAFAVASQDPAPPAAPDAQEAPLSSPPSSGASAGTGSPGADSSAPTGPSASTSQGAEDGAGPPADLVYSRPTWITIPAIDVRSRLVRVGLDGNGAMETPEPVDRAGWFEPSPPPGIPGATVIAGHVTWNQEPMVFFRLGDLRPGDRVKVTRKDGAVTVFEVSRIGSFPKDGFPTKAVYNQPDRSELRLITCGGEYDAANHRYLANVVVWAKIVDIRHAPA